MWTAVKNTSETSSVRQLLQWQTAVSWLLVAK